MDRRRLLALLGSAGLGGCLGADPGDPTTGTTTQNATTERQTTTGADGTATGTEPPDVGTADPQGGPPFDGDVRRYVYAPAADDASLAIAPAEQSGSLPRAEFPFTLTNGTDATFSVNFYAWKLWKRVDGEWFHVAPRMWPQPLMTLGPGDAHTWRLTVDNADLDRPIPRSEGTEAVTVVGLGAGTYAFGTDGWFEGDGYQNAVGLSARFDLSGDPLELTPTGIDSVERDGDEVVVRDDPDDESYLATYTVARVDDPPTEPRRLIAEQIIRDTPLRNALAHFESGVRKVVYRAETTTYPPFGVREPRYVAYDGDSFRIETAWVGDPPE